MRTFVLMVSFLTVIGQTLPAQAQWQAFYQAFHQDPHVPAFAHTTATALEWVVQDDWVDLGKVLDNPTFRRSAPLMTYVYADVVHVPAGFAELLREQALVIVARRIEVEPDAVLYLDYAEGQNASASFYTAEWQGQLAVVGFDDYEGQNYQLYTLGSDAALEVVISHDGQSSVRNDSDSVPAELYQFGDELADSLERAMLVASALPTDRKEERLRLLDWVLRVANRAPDLGPASTFGELAIDSAAQLAFWQSYARGSHVPELDREVYLGVGTAYVDAVERYEAQYDRFVDRAASTDQQVRAAELMLEHARAANEQSEAYLEQAQRGVDAAAETVREAERRFDREQLTTDLVRIEFEAGIELWKQEQTLQSVIKGFQALVSFGTIVVSAVALKKVNPAELGALFDAVGQLSSGAADAMKHLQEAMQATAALSSGSQALSDAITSTKLDGLKGALNDLDDIEGSFLFAGEEWTRFGIESGAMLQFAIDEKVRGAADYRTRLQLLTLSAQTLLDARRSHARALQEVAQIVLASRYQQGFEERVARLVASLHDDGKAEVDLAAGFARRMNELKRPVQTALLNFAAAFKYWALRDAEPPPSLLANTAELRSYLARVQRAYQNALTRFTRPPQRFQHKTLVVRDEVSLATFRATGEITLRVPLEHPVFRGLERVRLSGVRAWFEGAACPEQRCLGQVRTSGDYADRLGSTRFTFQGPALWRIFEYEADGTGRGTVLVDGALADEFAFAYFEPTPFTEWTVSLGDKANPGVDRSTVTSVTLEWSGNAIGSL